MNEKEKTILTALAVLIGLALLSSMTSCMSLRNSLGRDSLISGGNHKCSIKKSMKYSTWEYASPDVQLMISHSKSNLIFEVNKKK
jgi:hypothetical protein